MIELAHAPETIERGGGRWRQRQVIQQQGQEEVAWSLGKFSRVHRRRQTEDIKHQEMKYDFTHI